MEDDELVDLTCIPVGERSASQINAIYQLIRGIEGLSQLREATLRTVCQAVRYQRHEANDLIYLRGESCKSWYILLSGSVYIDGAMFLPRASFGKRNANVRTSECLCLEPTELLVIDYPEVEARREVCSAASRRPKPSSSRPHSDNQQQHQQRGGSGVHQFTTWSSRGSATTTSRSNSPERSGTAALRATNGRQSSVPPPMLRRRSGECAEDILQARVDPFLRVDHKALQRISNTSSNSSSSDLPHHSTHTSANASDLLDSDDDELEVGGVVDEDCNSSTGDTASLRDVTKEALLRDPKDRTEEEVDILLEALQNMPALCNTIESTRRALCAAMVYAVVERAGTVVMDHGEQLDSWCIILSGAVEVLMPTGERYQLVMGDSFGVSASTLRESHCGQMRTLEDECQFVCVRQEDYQRILASEQQNEVCIRDEEGKVCLVKEYRALDSGGNVRRGQIVIRGTADMLIDNLLENHSVNSDPNYVEDFLLTYRTFLSSPRIVAERLMLAFEDLNLRDRVTRVVLLWVNNHFNDFESDSVMMNFLNQFEKQLLAERKTGECRLLHIACSTKARCREIQLQRSTKEEMLRFSILGGRGEAKERHSGIYVSKVEEQSKAEEAGLRRADQIICVNNQSFEHLPHVRALELLKNTTHLSMTVRCNPLGFHEMVKTAHELATQRAGRLSISGESAQAAFACGRQNSSPEVHVLAVGANHLSSDNGCGTRRVGDGEQQHLLMPLPPCGPKRTQSGGRRHKKGNSEPDSQAEDCRNSVNSARRSHSVRSAELSLSNPDLSTCHMNVAPQCPPREVPDHVIKVYRADQKFRYLSINKETSAREVVMLAVQDFGITEPSTNFSLCKVLVDPGPVIRRRVLADNVCNLAVQLELSGRYYLRNNAKAQDVLANDDVARDILKESRVTLLEVPAQQLATRITLDDYELFRSVEATEYVEKICQLKTSFGTANLNRFEALSERESFWVQTEMVQERSSVGRVRLLKYFIKLARLCRDYKNFNTMMNVLQGLSSRPVQHLKSAWDSLPSKYHQMYLDLESALDVSRNMSKYRALLKNERIQPPMIPYYPIVSKDLTSIHVCNDTLKDGLVNFEKLRMLAREVRLVCQMCNLQYDPHSMVRKARFPIYSAGGPFNKDSITGSSVGHGSSAGSAGTAADAVGGNSSTLKRSKRRSNVLNPKRIYEEAHLAKQVRAYLTDKEVIDDVRRLEELSNSLETSSGGVANSNVNFPLSRKGSAASVDTGGFGSSHPADMHKLLALSDGKARPSKNTYPPSEVLQPPLSSTLTSSVLAASLSKRSAVAMAPQLSADSGSVRPAPGTQMRSNSSISSSSSDSGMVASSSSSQSCGRSNGNNNGCSRRPPLPDYHEALRLRRQQQQQYQQLQRQQQQQQIITAASATPTSSAKISLQNRSRPLQPPNYQLAVAVADACRNGSALRRGVVVAAAVGDSNSMSSRPPPPPPPTRTCSVVQPSHSHRNDADSCSSCSGSSIEQVTPV